MSYLLISLSEQDSAMLTQVSPMPIVNQWMTLLMIFGQPLNNSIKVTMGALKS